MSRSGFIFFAFFAVLPWFFKTGATTATIAMLRVRPHVVVAPDTNVTLAQVIDGQGISNELLADLRVTSLVKAPPNGERLEITEALLTAALRPLIQKERERSMSTTWVAPYISVPQIVILDTEKHDMDAELVRSELIQVWQPLCTECQLEVVALSLPKLESIRDWTLRIRPELPSGGFSVPVEVIRDSGEPFSAWISGRLIQRKKVPVARRTFTFNERVTPQDLTWEYRDVSYATDGTPGAAELAGKHLKQNLRAGEVLWSGMLEREKAVRRGDVVQVTSGTGNWEISITAIAQQDAFIGDTINVKNVRSSTLLMGQVTGSGEVRLR